MIGHNLNKFSTSSVNSRLIKCLFYGQLLDLYHIPSILLVVTLPKHPEFLKEYMPVLNFGNHSNISALLLASSPKASVYTSYNFAQFDTELGIHAVSWSLPRLFEKAKNCRQRYIRIHFRTSHFWMTQPTILKLAANDLVDCGYILQSYILHSQYVRSIYKQI